MPVWRGMQGLSVRRKLSAGEIKWRVKVPLAVLFGIFAVVGLLIAFIGHAARSSNVAPSMYRNDLSPTGYAIFVVCGLIALATAASFHS